MILGAGMLDPIVPFGFQIFTATDVTIAELSVGEVYYHAVAIQGEYVSVPDLKGRLVILDGSNKIVATLGENPDPRKGGSFNIPQAQWVEGVFSGTHGSYWDKDGNLYVQDWNVSGRIMKLVRVK